jgi:hypothetical protein
LQYFSSAGSRLFPKVSQAVVTLEVEIFIFMTENVLYREARNLEARLFYSQKVSDEYFECFDHFSFSGFIASIKPRPTAIEKCRHRKGRTKQTSQLKRSRGLGAMGRGIPMADGAMYVGGPPTACVTAIDRY